MHPLVNTAEQPLSQREEKLLAELEAVIDIHVKGYVPVGLALKEIRDQRLYRINYPVFEDYVLQVWDMAARRAYQLIEAAEAYENLKGFLASVMGDNCSQVSLPENMNHGTQTIEDILPKNERQARPLTEYSPEKQQSIWLMVLDKASRSEAKITATFIIQVILEMERKGIADRVKKHADRTNKEKSLPPLVKTTYQALLQVVQNQNDEDWKAVGKQTMISLLEDLLADLKHF
jgi:hypothetical protein